MKRYWLKVKTKRRFLEYRHNGETNLPEPIGSKMIGLIEYYNEGELKKDLTKKNLVTKMSIKTDSKDILKYIF